ncbi:hypothetical protein TWF281_004466 [Arthrobotrys megalospora]
MPCAGPLAVNSYGEEESFNAFCIKIAPITFYVGSLDNLDLEEDMVWPRWQNATRELEWLCNCHRPAGVAGDTAVVDAVASEATG